MEEKQKDAYSIYIIIYYHKFIPKKKSGKPE